MEILNVSEAAVLLRIGKRAVRKLIIEGRLHATRFGKGWRIRREDAVRAMEPAAAVE